MVRILAIGDPHFKVSNIRETDNLVEALIKAVIELKPDFVVVLGDTLDRHESIHVSPLTRAIKFLARIQALVPLYLLIGNHDLKNNRQFCSDEHPFTALKYWNNTTVCDTTLKITILQQDFIFVPYVPPGRFLEALNQVEWQNASGIFAHQEFKGCQMGAITSIEGDAWSLINPYVISGHIHDYQEPQVNILYTGTPIQHAYGDRHDKTISLLTFIDKNTRLHERINLGLPKKQIIYLNCSEVSSYIPVSSYDLKITISGKSGEIKAIMKHPNIEIWKKMGFKIVYKDIPLDKTDLTNRINKSAQLRFSTIFFNALTNNPRLPNLFNKLFGKISNTDQTSDAKIDTDQTDSVDKISDGINKIENNKVLTLNILN